MKRLLPLAFAALVLLPGAARAQDIWSWSIIIPSMGGTDILGTQLRNMREQQEASARGQAPAPAARPVGDPTSLRYVATPERRAANFSSFLSQRRSGDPAAVRELQQFLATPNLIPLIDRDLRKYGLRADNVADAYTAWWIQIWQTSRADGSDPSVKTVQAVKAQAERALLSTSAFTAADDAAKQAFAEGLLVQTAMMATAFEQAKSNPEQVRMLQQIARSSARQSGLDLDAMQLTDEGFRFGAE